MVASASPSVINRVDILRDVMSSILVPGTKLPKRRIGRLAMTVMELDFADVDADTQALADLRDGLARIVRSLASEQLRDLDKSVLGLSAEVSGCLRRPLISTPSLGSFRTLNNRSLKTAPRIHGS
ncbi:hypothetical protein JDV02_003043 [Purpureocillium takamizusanense]|uniref:Uncharacterized protein n=1 Tax=Purpureocillium takamizusanense TaxID=2060973 RepID=A0A9Q8QBL8_9HYPO|nr:uncharacterized protein JDV02_003043 [Purpureocillium takamizusanense]UNI16620.1 hypothetical protein JDV02_003043 [Purpureocillium takamizusanense]